MQHRGAMNIIIGRRRQPPYFVSTWKTDNAGVSGTDQIVLPLEAVGTYDFYVDWGDGSVVDHITAYNQAEVTHTFPAAGTYTVRIWGTIRGWRFNNGGDKLKILSILSWGPLRLGNSGGYFYGCANLTIPATDTLDMTGTTTLQLAFYGCTSIVTIPSLVTLDTSNVTNLGYFLYNCPLFNQPVNYLNTAKVQIMYYMFAYSTIFNQDVSGWNVEACTYFTSMLNRSGFNTINYDPLLVAWQAQNVKTGCPFSAGTAKYSAGAPATARAELVKAVIDGGKGWTITDGGPV